MLEVDRNCRIFCELGNAVNLTRHDACAKMTNPALRKDGVIRQVRSFGPTQFPDVDGKTGSAAAEFDAELPPCIASFRTATRSDD